MLNEQISDLDSLHEDDTQSSEIIDANGKKPGEEGYLKPEDKNDTGDKGKSGNDNADDNNNGNENENENESILTGTEKFLSQYNIEAGIIEFEDGSKKHFDELDKEEQFNVLKSLVEKGRTPIEKELDLDEQEIGFLNYARENNLTIQQTIDAIVEEEIARRTNNGTGNIDYNILSNEDIYMKYLKELNPDAKKEDLQTELEEAKKLKSFEKSVNNIKENYIKAQEKEIEEAREKISREEVKNLEAEREEIVNKVNEIKHVAGWQVSDEQKNECLSELVEVNEHGDSKFMERIFSNPELLFKVAWLEKFGEKYFDEMSEYYKNQISEARKRGKEEAINGLEKSPITTGDKGGKKTQESVSKREILNAKTLDDLHDNDDEKESED